MLLHLRIQIEDDTVKPITRWERPKVVKAFIEALTDDYMATPGMGGTSGFYIEDQKFVVVGIDPLGRDSDAMEEATAWRDDDV